MKNEYMTNATKKTVQSELVQNECKNRDKKCTKICTKQKWTDTKLRES